MRSKCLCPLLLMEMNLFIITRAYPITLSGTTPSKINSTLFGWTAVKFFDIVSQNQMNYNQHHYSH